MTEVIANKPFVQEDVLAYERKATFVQGVLTCGTVTLNLDATDLRKFLEGADALGQSVARDLALGFGFEVDPWKYEALRPCLMGMLQNIFLLTTITDPSQTDHLMSVVRAKQAKRIEAYHQKLAVLRAKPAPVVKVKAFGDLVRGGSSGGTGTPRTPGAPRATITPGAVYLYALNEANPVYAKFPAGGQKQLVVKAMADLGKPSTSTEIWDRVQANGNFVTGQGRRASDWILGEGFKAGYLLRTLQEPPALQSTSEFKASTGVHAEAEKIANSVEAPAAPVAEEHKGKHKNKKHQA